MLNRQHLEKAASDMDAESERAADCHLLAVKVHGVCCCTFECTMMKKSISPSARRIENVAKDRRKEKKHNNNKNTDRMLISSLVTQRISQSCLYDDLVNKMIYCRQSS